MTSNSRVPEFVLIAWLAVVALALAFGATTDAAPPLGDSQSYVGKAAAFWDMVHSGKFVNPLDLPWTFRPPGTILMAYPFGFTPDFRWFFFRSVFLPIVLLVAAVYIASYRLQLAGLQRAANRWITLALALTLAGMPILYQFQFNDTVPSLTAWGLVDNFFAGTAAVALASAMVAVRLRSRGWALAAVGIGALCLFIKPVGGLVMALLGLSWLILVGVEVRWNFAELSANKSMRRFAAFGLLSGAIIFAASLIIAFNSNYLSAENIALGRQAMSSLQAGDIRDVFGPLSQYPHLSFGYPLAAAVVLGLWASSRERGLYRFGVIALLCLAIGGAFLAFQADITQIRYSSPFVAMAFIALVPSMMDLAERFARRITMAAAAIFAAPTLCIAALLSMPVLSMSVAPANWQALFGVNLLANAYQAESDQALDLLQKMKAEALSGTTLYLLGVDWPVCAFFGQLEHENFIDPKSPRITARIGIDWQKSSAIRADDILTAGLVAFVPVAEGEVRDKILSNADVPDFTTELRLARAWASTLGEADGVTVVSETHVRLLKVVDPAKLEDAMGRLDAAHRWPAARPSNLKSKWSQEDVNLIQQQLPPTSVNIKFRADGDDAGRVLYTIHAATVVSDLHGLQTKFWVEPGMPAPEKPWYLFTHLVNSAGDILENNQVLLSRLPNTEPDGSIRLYSTFFKNRPAAAAAIGFGVYRPVGQSSEQLWADQGKTDWSGHRVLIPLP